MNDQQLTEAELDAIIASKRKPAIAMLRTLRRSDVGTPGCWLGGKPTLPPKIAWPMYVHDDGLEIPMHFLAQINLQYLPKFLGIPELPSTGTLFVFYEPALSPVYTDTMGRSPSKLQTGEGVCIIYVDEDVDEHLFRDKPTSPDFLYDDDYNVSDSFFGDDYFHKWPIDFCVYDTYPNTPYEIPFSCFNKLRDLEEIRNEMFYYLIQKESNFEYELKLHSMFGASQISLFPNKKNLVKRSQPHDFPLTDQHVMLFRFLPDRSIKHNTPEGAPYSFWILRSELSAGIFDNVTVWEDV